jgi:hypothetical protein
MAVRDHRSSQEPRCLRDDPDGRWNSCADCDPSSRGGLGDGPLRLGPGRLRITKRPPPAPLGRLTTVAVLVALVALAFCGEVAAYPPSVAAPVTSWSRVRLVAGPQDSFPVRVTPMPTASPSVRPERSTALARPTQQPRSVSVATSRLAGTATWFATGPDGMFAAAGPRLRAALGLHWRGQVVTVCADVCIRVTLDDWCACQPDTRLIDLSDQAFRLLAPLSRGVISVTLSW